MSRAALHVKSLSKQYQLGSRVRYKTLRDGLAGALQGAWKHLTAPRAAGSALEKDSDIKLWALKDVSFDIQYGEVVGVIGRNGAGKSTLLKVLSRITEPTSGFVDVYGRIGSLLEVGTGFHPELTGRENVYLNGAILGMKKAEIARRFDAIVGFSGIEKFLDTPVKHYSTGMYVRLAFAVAAHMEPEILLVDEVLAVGDLAFQRKCLGKMDEVAASGRAVLFVSHNMAAISRLCRRVIWLDEGGCVFDGSAPEAIRHYQARHVIACERWLRPSTLAENKEFSFVEVVVRDGSGAPAKCFEGNESMVIEVHYRIGCVPAECQIGMRFCNSEGSVVFTTADNDDQGLAASPRKPGAYVSMIRIPGQFLMPGTYQVYLAAHTPNRVVYEAIEQTVVIEVSPADSLASLDGRIGMIAPLISWDTKQESEWDARLLEEVSGE